MRATLCIPAPTCLTPQIEMHLSSAAGRELGSSVRKPAPRSSKFLVGLAQWPVTAALESSTSRPLRSGSNASWSEVSRDAQRGRSLADTRAPLNGGGAPVAPEQWEIWGITPP